MFKPLHLLTQAERDKIARDFEHRYDRPTTLDYAWYDLVRAIDTSAKFSMNDCDRSKSGPSNHESVSQLNSPLRNRLDDSIQSS